MPKLTCATLFLTFFWLTCARAQPRLELFRNDIQLTGHYQVFFTAPFAVALAEGDFNGDGAADLVIASGGRYSVLLNDGRGAFGEVRSFQGRSCGPLAAADFNNDGKLDLFASRQCEFSGFLWLGRGDGTFQPAREVPGCNSGAVGDFNRDGIPDLVCNDPASTGLSLQLGNGDGSFRKSWTAAPPSQAGIFAVSDFNGDRRLDFAVSFVSPVGVDSRSSWIVLGNGNGTFQAPIKTAGAPLAVGDLNGDGRPDFATASGVLLGIGNGEFSAERPYEPAPPDGFKPIALTDMNGDGRIDVIGVGPVFGPVENQVWIYYGRGDGSFFDRASYTVGWGPFTGVINDLDGDGKPDIAVANVRANTVSVLHSARPASATGVRAVSAASGTAVVSPGALATLNTRLPTSSDVAAQGPPWPLELAGIALEIRDSLGTVRRAPLLYVSLGQMNFEIPENCALGEASLTVIANGERRRVAEMTVETVAPGLFLEMPYSMLPAAYVLGIDRDQNPTVTPAFECPAGTDCKAVPVPPSTQTAESYLILYGTGFAGAATSEVKGWLRGLPIAIDSVGPSGVPGVQRIVIHLPDEHYDYWEGSREGSIILTVNEVASNTVWLLFDTGR